MSTAQFESATAMCRSTPLWPHFRKGDSPEAIQEQYPALSLEEVYGAIAAYLANRGEIEVYLQSQKTLWKKWETVFSEHSTPVIGRLRALRRGESRT